MTPDNLLSQAADHLTVSRVFGQPIERDGVTFIPVAVVMGGGGGGTDRSTGSGGGFGGVIRGIGAYTITNGVVRFRPAIDTYALGLAGFLTAYAVVRSLDRRRRRTISAERPQQAT